MRLVSTSFGVLLLFASLAMGGDTGVCRVHNKAMTKKRVEVILLVCRHNQNEWQQYTNARTRLFPNSSDEVYLDAGEVLTMAKKQLQKKYGWKSVPSHLLLSVCTVCDQRKGKWMAEHPPKSYKSDEAPPP